MSLPPAISAAALFVTLILPPILAVTIGYLAVRRPEAQLPKGAV